MVVLKGKVLIACPTILVSICNFERRKNVKNSFKMGKDAFAVSRKIFSVPGAYISSIELLIEGEKACGAF